MPALLKAPQRQRGPAGLFLALLLSACSMGPSFPDVPAGFQAKQARVGDIHQAYSGQDHGPIALFIHGTPGNWRGYRWYLADAELQAQFQLIAVDRPGFGNSNTALVTNLAEQTRLIMDSLPPVRPVYVIGHSLGGPIALWAARLYPERIEQAILLAASVDPHYEAPRWFNRLGAKLPLGKILSPEWERSNEEILALEAELEKLKPELGKIQSHVIVLQGDEDNLVDPRSTALLKNELPNSSIQHFPELGHFLLWDQPDLLKQALLSGTGAKHAAR